MQIARPRVCNLSCAISRGISHGISRAICLQEIALHLCIWGEAANLRFMPELLYFIFEVSRAYFTIEDPASPPAALRGSDGR